MALIKCQECGKEISEQAVACPGCGHPIKAVAGDVENIQAFKTTPKKRKKKLKYILLAIIAIIVIIALTTDPPPSTTSVPSAAQPAKITYPKGCQDYIALYTYEYYMEEEGIPEYEALAYTVNLWNSPARTGVVGKLPPGSRHLILKKTTDGYKVKAAPVAGGVIGWISAVQVAEVVRQDVEANKLCD